jgi:hypothetical protein
MSEIARAEGSPAIFGQSPFALARGQSFEAGLLRNGGERLLEALIAAQVLPVGANGLLDLRQRIHGGPMANLDEAIEATSRHFLACAHPDPEQRPRQCLIAGAALCLPGEMMLPEAVLVLDVLVVRRGSERTELIVGEVKTYPDRGGHTDGEQLATARAQAGAYAHGLELTLEGLGLAQQLEVALHGFLVLSKPGSNLPSVRAGEDLRYQLERARRGFELLRGLARRLGRVPADAPRFVREAGTSYAETCVSFCERASLCRERCATSGDPALLGLDMAHWLGQIRLPRALELLAGEPPQNDAEHELIEHLREAGALA